MKKENFLPLGVFICALVLLGAGCSSTETTTDNSDDVMKQSDDAAMMQEDTSMMEQPDDSAMMEENNNMMEQDDTVMMEEDTSMMETDDQMMEEDTSMMEATNHTFEMSGTNFAFSETELRVKKGDTVTIRFTSDNDTHDWVINEFDARTQMVRTGETSEVTFVADKSGEFEYYCSVGQHRANGMVGTLIVE